MLGGKLKTIIHNPYHYYIINTPQTKHTPASTAPSPQHATETTIPKETPASTPRPKRAVHLPAKFKHYVC